MKPKGRTPTCFFAGFVIQNTPGGVLGYEGRS